MIEVIERSWTGPLFLWLEQPLAIC
jgi:hypothetical protein